MKLAVVYRVVQGWRKPVFSRLAENKEFNLYYGCDFKETKVVSAPGPFEFSSKKMFSFPLGVKRKSGNMLVPFSPFLFFDLIKFKPDVVLCEGASNFINNISIFIYCKLFKKKMIQWGLGEIRGRKKSRIRKVFDRFIVPIEKRADAIVSYSTEGSKYYKKIGIPDEKIFVAVNVVDTDSRMIEIENFDRRRQPVSPCKETSPFKVVFVGALEVNKNIEMLINAFECFSQKISDVELHIIGGGDDESRLKKIAKHKGLDSIIFFHGRVEGPLIDHVYDKDVFVMPGLGGLAVSDMLCHGIPVICGIGDGCEKDLVNGGNGFLDDSLNESSILEYLTTLKNDPELLKLMKKNAKETTKSHNISNYVNNINYAINFVMRDK